MSAVFALLASLTYGAADFLGGMVGKRMQTLQLVFWSQLSGLVFTGLASLLFPATAVTLRDLTWGAVASFAGVVGIFALYQGLARGRMAVVSPLAGLLSALIPFGLGLGLGERLRPLELVGVALALPAIWIVSASSGAERGTAGAGMGILAGIGFGLFFAALAQAGDGAGYWPLVSGRATSFVVLGVMVARNLPMPPKGSRLAIVLLGFGDALANAFLLVAYRSGLLSLVSVLASLYPAVTVLLAVQVLKEPIARQQLFGLVLTVVAVALIAL